MKACCREGCEVSLHGLNFEFVLHFVIIIIIVNINFIILNSCLLRQFIVFHSFYRLQFVKQHYCHLVNELERLSVAVRAKDDLGCVLVNVLHSVGLAKDFIVGVLMDQVKRESMCKVVFDSDIQA